MAWYYGTYSCGHEGRVNIIGPIKNRQWKADREFEKLCPECWEKIKLAERKQKTKESLEKAKEMDLPNLTGSEKQIAWAVTLRQQMIEKIEKMEDMEKKILAKRHGITDEDIEKVLAYILETKTSAKYFIDRRHYPHRKYILEEKDSALAYFSEKESGDLEYLEQLETEATVFPEERQTDSVVTIDFGKDYVSASFERNEEFRKIVKSLGFSWDGKSWTRKITIRTGSASDRAAELGNRLLNEGFPIRIYDEQTRQKAIDGTFEPEHKRWISKLKDEKRFAISWTDGSDMYHTARSLPGSRWERPFVTVGVEHYAEVQEFAELYDFKFTPSAIEMMENYKKVLENAEVVKPKKVEEPEQKDGLKELLESGDDIIADLLD
ncbi:hypothetical protein [Bacillus smithii]|uniref:hypothetical protein n=1 Tax=Bacillus smithii TaxID=1479 RepID=UPI003D2135B2